MDFVRPLGCSSLTFVVEYAAIVDSKERHFLSVFVSVSAIPSVVAMYAW
jgi:hypothetical protein